MSVGRGEIIRVNLNSTSGRVLKDISKCSALKDTATHNGAESDIPLGTPSDKQQGTARPCLVISNTKFNHRRKMVIILPITNTIKPQIKTLVPLPDNLAITGSVDTEQVRNLDLSDRSWRTTGVVLDRDLIDYMVGMLTTLLSG